MITQNPYTIRDYQQEDADSVFREWERGNRATLLVEPTGCGKTVIAGEIASRIEERAKLLFLVHREELMFQSKRKLEEMTGHRATMMGAGEKPDRTAKFMVAMVQSLNHGKRYERFDKDEYRYLIIDESHHSPAKTYRNVIEYFDAPYVLGLTATPKRSDGEALGQVFDSVAAERYAPWAIENGWLTPLKSHVVNVQDMDLRTVNLSAGEFNQKQLRGQLEKQAVVDVIARQSMEIADGRQTVIFCQTVEQSEAVNRVIRLLGGNSEHIDGKIPKHTRRRRMDAFGDARCQFLCNCAVIEEGVDVPGIEVVAMARPTRSHTRIVQAIGRGLRPIDPPIGLTAPERRREIAASVKPHCTAVDFLGQLGNRLMHVSGDVLAGYASDIDGEERQIAIELARQEKGQIDWNEINKRAAVEMKRRQQEMTADELEKKKHAKLAAAESRWAYHYKPNPLNVLDVTATDVGVISKDDSYGRNLSDANKYLQQSGLHYREIQRMANAEQVALARKLWKHRNGGGCSWAQCRTLYKFGYRPFGRSYREASRLISRIEEYGWARPPMDGPNRVFLESQQRKLIK